MQACREPKTKRHKRSRTQWMCWLDGPMDEVVRCILLNSALLVCFVRGGIVSRKSRFNQWKIERVFVSVRRKGGDDALCGGSACCFGDVS